MMRFFKKGFSLTEIMLVMAVLLLVSAISIRAFQDTNKKQSLDKAVTNVVSIINSVRSLAVSSKGFCRYGVNISTTSSSISSFVVSDSGCVADNFEPTYLSLVNNFKVIISGSTIDGGSIIFQKITGNTTNTGKLSLQLKDNSNSSTTITIYPTGLLEIK